MKDIKKVNEKFFNETDSRMVRNIKVISIYILILIVLMISTVGLTIAAHGLSWVLSTAVALMMMGGTCASSCVYFYASLEYLGLE